jgi:DNA-binding SARP family transcriptional activator
MRFVLLGPVSAFDGEVELEIRGRLKRAILTTLLLQPGAVVSTDALIESIWGENSPEQASASLHNHLLRLRKALGENGGPRIRTVAPGYLIRVEPGELDVHVFEDLCAEGRQALRAQQWETASGAFRAALDVWQGDVLLDVLGSPGAIAVAERLREARAQALSGRIEADLHLGRPAEVIGDLRTLIAKHPLREEPYGQLMRALALADRRAEALEVFQDLRRKLAEELGVDPSVPLRNLHTGILRDEESALPRPSAGRLAPAPPAPGSRFQLPADSRAFTGRVPELSTLLKLARPARADVAETVVISSIGGMGGVGKTALALHAAHRLRTEFPDGQLFLDLRGFTPGVQPVDAQEALDRLLRSLGVPAQTVPRELDERAALYRHLLADTRTLIMLDNAADAAQVRPLLPGYAGCMVVVTSRRRLTDLDDAYLVDLDVLDEQEAVELLDKVAGQGRIPAGHPELGRLVELCGRLPLAIRIIGSRLRRERFLGIEQLVAWLEDEHARFGHLEEGDRRIAAVFASSYAALSAQERRVIRRLGLVPGTDFDAHAAAAVTGLDPRDAAETMLSLSEQNLLSEYSAGRYLFHDLTRVYVRGLLAEDPARESDAALDRLLDYYQHTVQAADRHVRRLTRLAPAAAIPQPASAPALADCHAALAWFAAERDNLVAAGQLCAVRRPRRVGALASGVAAYVELSGGWTQAAELHEAAVRIARELGDPIGEAEALLDLGRIRELSGDPVGAEHYRCALDLFREHGSRLGEAKASLILVAARVSEGEAGEVVEEVLERFRELGDRLGEAYALRELARLYMFTGHAGKGIEPLETALAILRDLGKPISESDVLESLGRQKLHTADFPGAEAALREALAGYRAYDNRPGQAEALINLGMICYQVTGDFQAAQAMFEEAGELYRQVGGGPGLVVAERHLALLFGRLGRYEEAEALFRRCLDAFRKTGSRLREANILNELGYLCLYRGEDLERGIELFDESLAICRENDVLIAEAMVLSGRGRIFTVLGDYDSAAGDLDRSLELFREFDKAQGVIGALDGIGELALTQGHADRAMKAYQEALDTARAIHSTHDEAHGLRGVGRSHARLGDIPAADEALEASLTIFRSLGAVETAAVEADLAGIRTTGRLPGH